MPKKRTNYFILENDIFSLRLDPYEFLIYAYLVSRAGGKGYCWPSYKTIAADLGITENTIIGKVKRLEQRGLIDIEHTTDHNCNGQPRRSNNRYHIRDIGEVLNLPFGASFENRGVPR